MLGLLPSYTVSFWYKAGVATQSTPFSIIGVQANGMDTPYALRIDNSSGRLEFAIENTTLSANTNLNRRSTNLQDTAGRGDSA
ncbi:hypothetical protein GC175_16445 [bacterium]|nr:hypothetical protein [bacterium]